MSKQFIDGSGNLVTAESDAQAALWTQHGLAPASDADLHHAAIAQEFGGWSGKLIAASAGVAQSIPGLGAAFTYGAAALATLGSDQSFTTNLQGAGRIISGAQEANPLTGMAGEGAGFAAQMVAGPVVAAVKGVKAAVTVASVAKSAALGAGISVGMTANELALEHANTGQGSEKMFSRIAWSAGLGAMLNVGISQAAPAIGRAFGAGSSKIGEAGTELADAAANIGQKRIMQQSAITKLADSGRNPEVQAYMGKRGMWNMTQDKITAVVKDDMAKAKGLFKEAKFGSDVRMDLSSQIALNNDIKLMAKGLDPTVTTNILKSIGPKSPASLAQLHNAREALDKVANYEAPASGYTQNLQVIRNAIDDSIDTLLSNSPDGSRKIAWNEANYLYRNSAAVGNGLNQAAAEGKGFWSWAGGIVGGASGAAAASSVGAPVALGSAGGAAIGNAVGGLVGNAKKAGLAEKGMRNLGAMFTSFDSDVAKVVVGKLGSAPGAGVVAEESVLHLGHYNQVAPILQMVAQNPQQSTTDFVANLDAQGVPGPMQDRMVAKHQEAVNFLASMLPKPANQGSTVAPTASQPTREQKMMFMEAAEAIRNPIGAMTQPTPTKLATVKQIYPEVFAQLQAVVGSQVAQRGNLSPSGRKWAGKIMGMPADHMSTPTAQQMLKQLDAMRQMAAQQQAQQAGGGGSPPGGSSATISETQSERLSK